MTRINLVPPHELHDKHLVAEYRELPRVFSLVRYAQQRGQKPDEYKVGHYVLGKGHVKFFYTRLAFLERRYYQLVEEMMVRGFKPAYPTPNLLHINPEWFGDYEPSAEALKLNRKRIQDRWPHERRPTRRQVSEAYDY